MVRITKAERQWLEKNGYLRLVRGQYPDMVTVNRQSKHKKYYVNERLLVYLEKYNQK